MFWKRRTEGAHRSDGQGAAEAPGVAQAPERDREMDAVRRQEADSMTAELGCLVMWSPGRGAFVAFGWSVEPLVGVDRGEIEREIRAACARMWPGGQ